MSDDGGRHSRSLVPLVMVVVPAVLAVVLGSIDLAGRSLWIDESATFAISSQHGSALWAAMRRDGGNMLAYYALEHLLLGWFGHGTVVMRLPSVIANGVTAGTVVLIGRRLFSPVVGGVAGALTAVSLPLLYWAQDARGYALMFAFVSLSYLGFVSLVDTNSPRRRGRPPSWAWPLYTGGLVLALYMSFVAVLIVPAQLVSLLWRRRRLWQVGSALATAAILSVPLVVLARGRGAAQLFWVARPGAGSTGEVAEAVTSSGLPPLFHQSALTIPLLVVTIALTLFAVVSRWSCRSEADSVVSQRRFAVALVVAWALVPTLLDSLESLVGQSLYEPRYLLISAPAFSLAVACALFASRAPRWFGWGAFVILLTLRSVVLAPTYGVSPENWRAATEFVLNERTPGDCVAFYPEDGRQVFDYYVVTTGARTLPRPVLPTARWREIVPYVERYVELPERRLAALPARCRLLFLVSSHAGSSTGTTASRGVHHRLVAFVDALEEAYPSWHERSFGYAAPVRVWKFSR